MIESITQIAKLTAVEADSNGVLPKRIHLLRIGNFKTEKYGEIEVTADDCIEYVEHFNAGYGRPGPDGQKGGLPCNIRHDKGGVAATWINGLEFDGKNLWGVDLEWTGAGRAEVEAGNYRYFSSEFTPRSLGGLWTNPENTLQKVRNVFTGCALTNIPMFSGNQGVLASAEADTEDGKQVIYVNANEEKLVMNADLIRVKKAADLTAEEKTFVEAHQSEFNADELKQLGVEASNDNKDKDTKVTTVEASAVTGDMGLVQVEASEIVTMREELATAKKAVEASAAEKTELQKQVDANSEQLANIAKAGLKTEVEAHAARGAIKGDAVDKWVERASVDASVLEDLKELPSNEIIGKEYGNEHAQEVEASTDSFDKKVREVMASNEGMTYSDATIRVAQENPELANAHTNSVGA